MRSPIQLRSGCCQALKPAFATLPIYLMVTQLMSGLMASAVNFPESVAMPGTPTFQASLLGRTPKGTPAWAGIQRDGQGRPGTKNPAFGGVLCVFRDVLGLPETLLWCPGEDSNLHEVAPAST